jgi:hypothetical protein
MMRAVCRLFSDVEISISHVASNMGQADVGMLEVMLIVSVSLLGRCWSVKKLAAKVHGMFIARTQLVAIF